MAQGLECTCRTEVPFGWPRYGLLLRRGYWAQTGHVGSQCEEREVRPGTRPVGFHAWALSPYQLHLVHGRAPSMWLTSSTPRRVPVREASRPSSAGVVSTQAAPQTLPGFLQSPWVALGTSHAPTPGLVCTGPGPSPLSGDVPEASWHCKF